MVNFTKLNLMELNVTMKGNLIQTNVLKNGLILEIYDQSREIAGNRWLVKMAATIEIPIDRLHLGDGLNKQVDLNSLKKSFGNFVRYEQKRERNFIAEKEKNIVFDDLMSSFLTSTRRYLSHPNFAVRYAVKAYLKLQEVI